MTGDPNADQDPRSPSDEERFAALRAHSPRAALMDRLDLLEGGIPGRAAFQAAQRLLPKEAPYPGMEHPPGARWNAAADTWEVDDAAAMQLWWAPGDGGLPPRDMVDAFLAGYVERTGDDDERRLVEQLYAEAEQQPSEPSSASEASPGNTQAEASAVAERYGYGGLVQTITLDAPSGLFGFALILVIVLALLGTVFLFQSDGDTSARVGGIVLYLASAAVTVLGFMPLRRPRPPISRLFVFSGGIVFAVDGLLDPYAWPDLELHRSVVTSTVGSDQREVRRNVLWIGPRGRGKQFIVPSLLHETMTDLARAGGATIS